MSDIKDVKHLRVVDLHERLEVEKKEARKLPDHVVKDLERFVEAAKTGKIKQAIVFFHLEEEVTAEPIELVGSDPDYSPNDPVFFFYDTDSKMTDLYFTSEYIKNCLFDTCIDQKLGKDVGADDDHEH
jgi:hypothetical protein